MSDTCPVCEAPLLASSAHCPRCGFPSALFPRLDGPIALPPEAELPAAEPSLLRGRTVADDSSPEAEVNASIARGLEERMELLRSIDREAPDVTGEMCEAALDEASGRASEAQQVLRSAEARLGRDTEELLSRHLENLEARGRRLEANGLRLALEEELGQLAETIVGGPPAVSVAALATAERRMDDLETRWRGLQDLMDRVAGLRAQASDLGIPLDRLPDRLTPARAGLAGMPATEQDLESVATLAAEMLMQLHEAIPPALEEELSRQTGALEGYPAPHPPRVKAARRHHAEAIQHLKAGRLEDAVRSVRELRAALEHLAREAREAPQPEPSPPEVASSPVSEAGLALPGHPVPVPAPVEASPAPEVVVPTAPSRAPQPEPVRPATTAPAHPAPSARSDAARPPSRRAAPDATMVGALLMKARSLAARVRSLPPDSPAAAEAARQIHDATALLQARRFSEADEALSRLMRSLADQAPRS